MKRLLTLLICTGMLAMAAGPEDAVRKAMDDFATAVLKKDIPTLEKLFADNVMYSHSNGKVETKAEAIAAFKTAEYKTFKYAEQKFQSHGNVVLVRGDVEVLNTASNPAPLKLSVLQVWVKGPKGWQMSARQSTRLP